MPIDLLSGGRIVTAVAAGWMEGEFEMLGASFEQRGKLLNEWLQAALSVFEQMPGEVEFHGELLSFKGWLAPALVRPGGWRSVARRPGDRHEPTCMLRGDDACMFFIRFRPASPPA